MWTLSPVPSSDSLIIGAQGLSCYVLPTQSARESPPLQHRAIYAPYSVVRPALPRVLQECALAPNKVICFWRVSEKQPLGIIKGQRENAGFRLPGERMAEEGGGWVLGSSKLIRRASANYGGGVVRSGWKGPGFTKTVFLK